MGRVGLQHIFGRPNPSEVIQDKTAISLTLIVHFFRHSLSHSVVIQFQIKAPYLSLDCSDIFPLHVITFGQIKRTAVDF